MEQRYPNAHAAAIAAAVAPMVPPPPSTALIPMAGPLVPLAVPTPTATPQPLVPTAVDAQDGYPALEEPDKPPLSTVAMKQKEKFFRPLNYMKEAIIAYIRLREGADPSLDELHSALSEVDAAVTLSDNRHLMQQQLLAAEADAEELVALECAPLEGPPPLEVDLEDLADGRGTVDRCGVATDDCDAFANASPTEVGEHVYTYDAGICGSVAELLEANLKARASHDKQIMRGHMDFMARVKAGDVAMDENACDYDSIMGRTRIDVIQTLWGVQHERMEAAGRTVVSHVAQYLTGSKLDYARWLLRAIEDGGGKCQHVLGDGSLCGAELLWDRRLSRRHSASSHHISNDRINDWWTHLFLISDEGGFELLRPVCRMHQASTKRFLARCPCGRHPPFFIWA